VLITGTSLNGIGYETALAIAKHANLVVITGYNADRLVFTIFKTWMIIEAIFLIRLKLSEDAIKKEVPTANIHRLPLDLSSLVSVRKAAEVVNANPLPLHVNTPFISIYVRQ
jgi:NAD(P)-dependent dehydrogenase (short-subunit alcohol dehydrogenase family)